jgi:cytochrome P450/NADPH-cytochrome P450 reductase
MAAPIDVDEIPGPRGVPFLGNVFDIDSHSPVEGLVQMARQYGPIYKVSVPAGTRLMISDPDLVNEICDDARFDKKISAGLAVLSQSLTGRGLFTSETSDPLWQRAHNILMAPFSLQAMRDYIPRMLDIANQLTDKWTRLNPGDEVDVPASMTALTLDTIALCGFDYRFNSFYRDTPHPFVEAMVRSLLTAQARARRLPALNRLRIREQRQLDDDQMFMKDLVGKLIAERRQQGGAADNSDLLGRMLTGVDPQSGKGLPDDNIISQCLTFLIAGHETTSGLLSFAIYYLVKNPEYAKRARTEIDEVFGDSASPSYEQVHRLTYVLQILEESLRLWPTAPLFTRTPRTDTVIGGRYAVPAGIGLTVLIPMLHRHQGVWGADVEQFNPDHLSPQHKTALPPNAYKPFGTGQRACIGRQFALQEATLVLGMLLQRFELVDHLNYQLKTKQTLTVKPDEFRIQVRPREGRTLARTGAAPTAARAARAKAEPAVPPVPATAQHGTPLRVLFGSNLGTAEAIANKLASEGTERGFAVTLGPLDDHIDDLPADGAILLVCSSYNGTPPENAVAFCRWLRDPKTPKDACAGASYAVFGCGAPWEATCRAVPRLLDTSWRRWGPPYTARGAGNSSPTWTGVPGLAPGLWRDVAAALSLPRRGRPPTTPRPLVSIVGRRLPIRSSSRTRPTRPRCERTASWSGRATRAGPSATSRWRSRQERPTGPGTTSACCPATASMSSGGSCAGSPSMQACTSRSSPRAANTPTCPSTSRRRCSACSAAASSFRTSPAAKISKCWPSTTTMPNNGPRWRPWPRMTTGRKPATGSGWRSPIDPLWTCSISSPPVGYRSRSTLTFCRRCGPATTPSPPRHWSRRRSAASLWGFCAPPRAPATASSRGSAPTTWLP